MKTEKIIKWKTFLKNSKTNEDKSCFFEKMIKL